MKISLLAFLRCGSPAVNKSSRTNPYWFGSKSYHKTPLYESNPVSYWTGRDGNKKLAFRHVKPCKLGGDNDSDVGRSNTTVLFLNGLLSNMNGTKCNALQIHCTKNGVSFLCFDYRGHGQSSGHFIDCTMHDWVGDASDMLDHVISLGKEQQQEANVILIGSSLGAWISLVLAMKRPDVITAVIGIGSAIDYTSDTYKDKLTDEQRAMWENSVGSSSTSKIFEVSSPYLDDAYPFTRDLYQSGNDYLICQDHHYFEGIANRQLRCPVRFLHGSEDDVIHFQKIYDVANALQSKYSATDISIKLLKGGDHRLSRADDIQAILDTLDEFL
jgi:pimeloyl-ACP methyl ester carboxylesterase